MTMRYSIKLAVDVGDRDGQVALRALQDAVASHGVRRPSFNAPGFSQPVDSTDGHQTAYFDLLADDDAELRAGIQTVVDVLQLRGITATGDPVVFAAHVEPVPSSRFPGVEYDADQQLLKIQTWALDQHDLELSLVQGQDEGEVVVLLASTTGGGREEEGFTVRRLLIDRPAGPGALRKE